MSSNVGKYASSCLELLIEKLSDIQTTLPDEYRHETILRNKPLNEAINVESCQLAYHRPADTIQGVNSDLHSSLATTRTGPSSFMQPAPTAPFVNRRLVRKKQSEVSVSSRSEKCFVCGVYGYLSTNHSLEKRLESYRKHKSVRQFTVSLQDDAQSDSDDKEVVDAIEDTTLMSTPLKKKTISSGKTAFHIWQASTTPT